MIDLNNVLNNSASLEVQAHWAPIADTTYNLHKKSPENVEFFDLSPQEATRKYKGEAFNAFFPASTVAVGDDFGYADMIFVPRMELLTMLTEARDDIEWESTITLEEARKAKEGSTNTSIARSVSKHCL